MVEDCEVVKPGGGRNVSSLYEISQTAQSVV